MFVLDTHIVWFLPLTCASCGSINSYSSEKSVILYNTIIIKNRPKKRYHEIPARPTNHKNSTRTNNIFVGRISLFSCYTIPYSP